jgi:hypothetical protein
VFDRQFIEGIAGRLETGSPQTLNHLKLTALRPTSREIFVLRPPSAAMEDGATNGMDLLSSKMMKNSIAGQTPQFASRRNSELSSRSRHLVKMK